jgi:ribosomal protein S18 acetylase RimI-like enzyme
MLKPETPESEMLESVMLKPVMLEVVKVTGGENLALVRKLFLAYADWTGVDLSFQNFNEEFDSLPGNYAPPDGCLLLALYDGKPAGCVAVRKLEEKICEMKRLYVSQEFQGLGIGVSLAKEIIIEANNLGYAKMRLDTLAKMTSAQKLYHSLGFREIEPYRYNPEPGTVFMELDLGDFQITTDLFR